jgi:membrane protease YdiL (CAAX protease family)
MNTRGNKCETQKGLFSDASPFTQLIMLGFAMATCFFLLMFVGVLFMPLILGIPFGEIMTGIGADDEVQNLNLIRYLQTLFSISLFIVPAFLAAYLFSANVTGYLGLKRTAPLKWFGTTLLLMLAAIPCINMLAALNEMIVFPESLSGLEQWLRNFEEAAQQTTKRFLNVDNVSGMFFNIFMIAVLPALGEELIFRGVLQKIFTRWTGNIHIAIVVTGFLFSLMHGQFYGLFPRWLLGVMFGYLLVWSGTIWLPIFAHFVHNAVAVCIFSLIHKEVISEDMEVFGSSFSDVPVTIVATVASVWLLWKIYRNMVNPEPNAEI